MKYCITLLLLLSSYSQACSYGRSFSDFIVTNEKSLSPNQPNLSVHEIVRGKAGGGIGSCGDAGFVILKMNNDTGDSVGYIFELHEGEFEDDLFMEKNPIIPASHFLDEGLFHFIWLDGRSDDQEPFNIVVKIVAMSKSGQLSEPQFLTVNHQGTKSPWWKIW